MGDSPRLGRTAGILLESPLMLVVMIFAARWIILSLAVPRVLGATAAIGLVALGMLLVAEVIGARWLRGLSITDYLASFDPITGGISLLMFFLFAAMPMLIERR